MGAFGDRPFENDAALDWLAKAQGFALYELKKAVIMKDWDIVRAVVDFALSSEIRHHWVCREDVEPYLDALQLIPTSWIIPESWLINWDHPKAVVIQVVLASRALTEIVEEFNE